MQLQTRLRTQKSHFENEYLHDVSARKLKTLHVLQNEASNVKSEIINRITKYNPNMYSDSLIQF